MKFLLFLFGGIRVSLPFSEATRFLNLCMCLDLPLSKQQTVGGKLVVFLPWKGSERLLKLCRENGISVEILHYGVPFWLWRRRKRAGLLVGGGLGLALMLFSSSVVWDVRVTGNEILTKQEVLEELAACGFGVGSNLNGFSAGTLENSLLMESDRIAWISVCMNGTVAEVQVIERVEEKPVPTAPANLVASSDGQVEWLELTAGNAVVSVGQAVKKGELLVSGVYDSATRGARFTRASGRVMARTERLLTIEIPYAYEETVVQSEKNGSKMLKFFDLDFFFSKKTGNVNPNCDIIETVKTLDRFGLANLPFSLVCSVERTSKTVWKTRSRERAVELAFEELDEKMAGLSGDCLLLRKSVDVEEGDAGVILTCRVICLENIASLQEFEVDLE